MSPTLPKQQHKKLCQLSPNSGSGYHRLFIVDCLLCHFDCLLKQAACKLCFGPRLPCHFPHGWVGGWAVSMRIAKGGFHFYSSSGNMRIGGRRHRSPEPSKVVAPMSRRRILLPAIPPLSSSFLFLSTPSLLLELSQIFLLLQTNLKNEFNSIVTILLGCHGNLIILSETCD